MKKTAVVILLFVSSRVMAGGWIFKAGNNFGYNPQEITLWNYPLEHQMSRGIYVGLGYEFSLFERVSLAIIPEFNQYYSQATVNQIEASGYSYHFNLPFHIVYSPLDKWQFLSGISIQNYRQFEDFAFNKSHNLRYDLDFAIIYKFTETWAIELAHSLIISNKVDALLIRNYSNYVSLGLRLNFSHAFKKKL